MKVPHDSTKPHRRVKGMAGKDKQRLVIYTGVQGKQQLQAIADKWEMSLSQVTKMAIASFLQSQGESVQFGNQGGADHEAA